MVAEKESTLKEANKAAVPGAIEELKTHSKTRFKEALNEAIEKAVGDMVKDLSDDTLPYLGESEMAKVRADLIAIVKDYGKSRLDK